ncbi:MAG: thioredoxin domain-containing protein [Myxococcota bacterium]|nr:thioredoxin domain-containing protein [Myxococcota bacterium]
MITYLILFACSRTADVAALPGDAVAGSSTATLASWTGGAISQAQVEEEANAELIALEVEYLQSRHEVLQQTAHRMVINEAMGDKAKSEGMELDPWLEKAVSSRITPATEEEIQAFYEHYKSQMNGQELDVVRPQVVAAIEQQRGTEAAKALVGELYETYKIQVDVPYPEMPRIPIEEAGNPSLGPENAEITIVEFAEYECGYCSRAKVTIDRLMEEYEGRIRLVYRDFPLQFHERAIPAAVAANCAGEQSRYWEMHNTLLSGQSNLDDASLAKYAEDAGVDMDKWRACVAKPEVQVQEIMADMEAGAKAGVTGTPAFFVNGIFLSGALPYEAFKELIERELEGS